MMSGEGVMGMRVRCIGWLIDCDDCTAHAQRASAGGCR